VKKDILTKKFEEWTEGLGPEEARISVFGHIRDIPYAIIPELRDPYRGPAGMLTVNKGSCQPKHFLLADFFRRLGIPVRYATYPFRWADAGINYPADMKKMVKGLPPAYHLACKARIGAGWALVDATWDLPLKKAGMRVNDNWDGMSDTINAVVPIEEALHDTIGDRVSYEATGKASYTGEERALYAEFIDKLNRWLDSLR
jgi:hypothetical protein